MRLLTQKSIFEIAVERDSENKPGKFAVESVVWRRVIDWSVAYIPPVVHRPLIWITAFLFFFIANQARISLLRNLRLAIPGSWRMVNYFRVVRVFGNFGWSLTDAVTYRIRRPRFRYELEGGRFLEKLSESQGAIVLTAHMGNYDLGTALFTERFHRTMKMVRAPEPDQRAARHVDLALQQSSAGAVKVGYSDDGTSLAFDLLNNLRDGDIVCIQGDRVIGDVARAPVNLFNREVFLPNGPFVLSLVSEIPIYPLFVVRTGYRKYKIVAREPIRCFRDSESREKVIAGAMESWARVLEEIVREYWPQWFAFTPLESSSSSSSS